MSVRNLDSSIRKAFEKLCSSQNIPTFHSLIEFVNENCTTQELLTPPSSQLVHKKMKTSLLCNSAEPTITKPQDFKSKIGNFVVCNGSHPLYVWLNFKDMSEDDRSNSVQQSHKCFRCLGSHLSKDCTSQDSCKISGKVNHHTLLHRSVSTNWSHNKGRSVESSEKLYSTSTSSDTVPPVIFSL